MDFACNAQSFINMAMFTMLFTTMQCIQLMSNFLLDIHVYAPKSTWMPFSLSFLPYLQDMYSCSSDKMCFSCCSFYKTQKNIRSPNIIGAFHNVFVKLDLLGTCTDY